MPRTVHYEGTAVMRKHIICRSPCALVHTFSAFTRLQSLRNLSQNSNKKDESTTALHERCCLGVGPTSYPGTAKYQATGNFPARPLFSVDPLRLGLPGSHPRLVYEYRGYESLKSKCRSYCFGGWEVCGRRLKVWGKGAWYRAGNWELQPKLIDVSLWLDFE